MSRSGINQVARLLKWLQQQGCAIQKLNRKVIERQLEKEALPATVRRVLELRLGGAQAAVKKIDALLARAGTDNRVRGGFRYHGASTGRWAGEGFQPQNLKRPVVEDLNSAIAAVATGKTFVMFDLASALMTGQPFLGHAIKRQCGVLLIAPEGANQVPLRLEAVVREKCGDMRRAPFCWYETAPMLLHHGSAEKLIAMARQAEDTLQREFGLPLGLIAIDTIAACAGYARAGDENDAAAGQAVMNVLKTVAQALNSFALGVEHFGKNPEAGTRGASSKEASSDLVLACLGRKEVGGDVVNTRLAVRKNRGGRQGQEHPFTLRIVKAPEPDEDGEPVTTMVVDWQAAPASDTPA
jgi:AAA domain